MVHIQQNDMWTSGVSVGEIYRFWNRSVHWKTNEWMKTFFLNWRLFGSKGSLVLQSQLTTGHKELCRLYKWGLAALNSWESSPAFRVYSISSEGEDLGSNFHDFIRFVSLMRNASHSLSTWCNLCLLPFAPSRII